MAGSAYAHVTGNVGGEPETRKLDGGREVASFSIAVNMKRGRDETVEWYRASCFSEGLVDVVMKYVRKGDPIHVRGRLSHPEWTDREGLVRVSNEISVDGLDLLGAPPAGGRDDRGGRDTRAGDRGGRGDDRGGDRRGDDRTRGAARDEPRGGGRDDRGGRGDDRGRGGGRDDDRARGGSRDDDRGRGGREETRGDGRGRMPDDEIPF